MYCLFVRQALEFAVPVWAPSLTQHNSQRLERLQGRAVNLICPTNTLSLSEKLSRLSLLPLETRRKNILRKYAVSLSKNPDFQYLFTVNKYRKTRNSDKFYIRTARTRRYEVSSLPSFLLILNEISREHNKQ